MKLKIQLILPLLFLLLACSKEELFAPAHYTISGKVEKGPFVSGSIVTLEPLDGRLHALGSSFITTVKDDEGNFDFGTLTLESPYALLTAQGHFFDELRGELSSEPITLQAIVDCAEQTTTNINLLTHLKKERVKRLIASGRSFAVANQQAQAELLESFALQHYAATDAANLSIATGTAEAAALILISSALLQDRSETEFKKHITRLTKEFAFGGTFSDPIKEQYQYSTIHLRKHFSSISNHIVERYKEQGSTVTVKDLAYFVDWDKDGIAGNELGDPNVERILKFETTELNIPMQGGIFTVKLNANIPYTFTNPIDEGIFRDMPSDRLFRETEIAYKQALKEDVLTFTVAPASNRIIKNKTLELYSMDGKLCSTLLIKQEGDPTKKNLSLTTLGREVFTQYCEYMSIALSYYHTEEALYTKLYQTSSEIWMDFKQLPLLPSSFMMSRSWELSYRALLGNQRALLWMGSSYTSMLTPYLTCADAAMYYEMVVLWGHVVYLQGDDPHMKNSCQLTDKELFAKLSISLKQGLIAFDEQKNGFENVGDMFLLSKDVPRALLAKMHLYCKEYNQAYTWLKQIVDTQHYQLENSREQAMGRNSREIIYGLFPPRGNSIDAPFYLLENEDARMPSVTYTEVLLSLAECAYQLGNKESARNYLTLVTKARGLTSYDNKEDFIPFLQKVWASELKGTGTYFAFLKRNKLAQTLLHLDEYMLLFPIPKSQVDQNPAIQQNPGYTSY